VLEADDWTRLDRLLQGALDRPSGERERWLDEACGGDSSLRRRVATLVRLAEEESDPLPRGGAISGGADEDGNLPSLLPGNRLGRYEILSLLGAGGMGRVYCALDPALGREVAIKALARTFRGDSASLRRFEREARVLATLSHPNIAAIYGFEVLDGAPYLILERIEGETLAERLKRGPLKLREAVAVATQVADGLAEAHGKGVIHRDLKPSNVMLAPGGRAKLVDFGLAKTSAPARGGRLSTDLQTAAGIVVGTAPYMSPEQINGEEVDARTDVWAFGCVLYEMLAGREAFRGHTVPEVLATVLRDEPDWNALPGSLPPQLLRLLQRCLRKEPRDRLQHIGDARLELIELGEELPASGTVRARRTPGAFPWAAAAAAALAIVALALLLGPWRQRPEPRALRLSLELPRGLTLANEYNPPFAIAPTGSPLVLVGAEDGKMRLHVRSLDDLTTRALPGTEDARQPFFSPDGRWVAFFADRKLKKVPLGGGASIPICEIGSNPRGGAWAPDGTIVVAASQSSGLVRVPDGGGRPSALTTLDFARGEASHRWPEVLPGGRWVLFSAAIEGESYDEARLEAVSLTNGERRPVLSRAAFGRYAASGHLLFVRGGRLYAVAFDPNRLETRGTPETVLDGVRYEPQNGAAHVAVSASGALVYGPGLPTSPEHYLAWLDREGRLTRIVETPRTFREPRLSPDGRRAAVVIGTAAESDLWLVDVNVGTLSRLSFGLSPHRPTWTPDGARITVGAEKDGSWRLLTMSAEGKGDANVLCTGPHRIYPNDWSRDGRRLVFQENRPDTGWDLRILEVDAAGRSVGPPRSLAASPFHESNAALSTDGRWLAYESDEVDAVVQIHALSFPDGGHRLRVSTGGARWPVWGRDRELTYRDTSHHRILTATLREKDGDLLVDAIHDAVRADGASSPSLARIVITVNGARFDVDPASGRLLVLETSAVSVEPPLSRPVIVLDWADELRRRLHS
jgi:Tol biopolymer transport system component